MKILVIDNYDSFVYNLVHIIKELGHEPDVYRNDKISLDDVEQYDKILLSPGPGIPKEAGIMMDLLARYKGTKSILGVCLGHQAIAESYGGSLESMSTVLHGFGHEVEVIKEEPLLAGIESPFTGARYHSWVVKEEGLPAELEVTAKTKDGAVMAIRHTQDKVKGFQFHPESVLTTQNEVMLGKTIIGNWLKE